MTGLFDIGDNLLQGSRHHAVTSLLERFAAGRGGDVADMYTTDAVLDATVPGWRYSRRGARAIADQYATWFKDLATFEALDRVPTPTGEVAIYVLAWEEQGMPHAAHHCHVFDVDPGSGRIERDRVFCGGRWGAADLAAMAEAQVQADRADLAALAVEPHLEPRPKPKDHTGHAG